MKFKSSFFALLITAAVISPIQCMQQAKNMRHLRTIFSRSSTHWSNSLIKKRYYTQTQTTPTEIDTLEEYTLEKLLKKFDKVDTLFSEFKYAEYRKKISSDTYDRVKFDWTDRLIFTCARTVELNLPRNQDEEFLHRYALSHIKNMSIRYDKAIQELEKLKSNGNS